MSGLAAVAALEKAPSVESAAAWLDVAFEELAELASEGAAAAS